MVSNNDADNWDNEFQDFRRKHLDEQVNDTAFVELSKKWLHLSSEKKYSYQFDWLGIPIIQMPTDIVIFQEIIWRTRPDLIIETGVARGGSINFWASIQNLCQIEGHVIGIDIDIRDHAKNAIEHSRFKENITLIEGDSTGKEILEKVSNLSVGYKNTMVVLDSNHTHEHVLKELELYSELVSEGCYLLVLDTMIEDLPVPGDRPWQPGNSPKSAVKAFMNGKKSLFSIDTELENRSLLTVAPYGFLVRNSSSESRTVRD